MVRRAIMGGTFDPPHLAHLVAGEAAFRSLGVDVVTFVPAGAPWQKADRDVTDAVHRWEMTKLATDGIEYFEADDREVHRDGWTYTIDTVESFPDEDELILILGSDAAAGLHTWDRSERLLEMVQVAVAERPGTSRRDVESEVGPVTWLEMPRLPVSGTDLRRIARRGGSIRFLVREAVWAYIDRHELYRVRG